jgi:hypothetical protein
VSLLLTFILGIIVSGEPSPVETIFAEGETLTYNLSWMRITGGVGTMTIAPVGAESERYRITSVAHSTSRISSIYRFRDEIETIVARRDFSTLRFEKNLDEKGDRENQVTVIEDGIATRTTRKVKKIPVPRPVLDPISVIYYMRTLDLTPGKRYPLTLIADGKLYTVDARVLRRETIETPVGRFSTVVVEPAMLSGEERDETLQIWYTDDARHIPVRIRSEIKIGAVTANLRSVDRGVAPAAGAK